MRSANVGMSVVGRLSTQKKPMSYRHLMAKLLPAPLMPVMTTKAMLSAIGLRGQRRLGASRRW